MEVDQAHRFIRSSRIRCSALRGHWRVDCPSQFPTPKRPNIRRSTNRRATSNAAIRPMSHQRARSWGHPSLEDLSDSEHITRSNAPREPDDPAGRKVPRSRRSFGLGCGRHPAEQNEVGARASLGIHQLAEGESGFRPQLMCAMEDIIESDVSEGRMFNDAFVLTQTSQCRALAHRDATAITREDQRRQAGLRHWVVHAFHPIPCRCQARPRRGAFPRASIVAIRSRLRPAACWLVPR